MSTLKVIDVSSNNGSANVVTKYGADACIVKATQGTGYVNSLCNAQFSAAKKAGMKLGLYHYAGGGNPIAEANYFINNIKNYVGQGVLVLDWEQGENAAWGNTNWCRQFVDHVHALTGVWCFIYTGKEGTAHAQNCANDCPLWFADYPDLRNSWNVPNWALHPYGWKDIAIWQFTNSQGRMDRSIAYFDKKTWDKFANPSSKTVSKPTVETKTYYGTNPVLVKATTAVYTYKDVACKQKVKLWPKDTQFDIEELVHYANKINRLKLANGLYLSGTREHFANMYYIDETIKRIKTKKTVYLYKDKACKQKLRSYPAGTEFNVKIVRYEGSWFSRFKTESGYYLTANKNYVGFVK